MKTTLVSLMPSEGSVKHKRPALTPELLAATGARYSRNNEGLDAILSKIEFGNKTEVTDKIIELIRHTEIPYYTLVSELCALLDSLQEGKLDASVDSIFKMIDYGHASIADMAPIAIFIDQISIYAAYYLFSICPLAGGQESSTRYIKLDPNALPHGEELGIPESQHVAWRETMERSFESYNKALHFWGDVVDKNPSLVNIPDELLKSDKEHHRKQVERMKRNYTFDRSRYFIPVAALTNVMLVQSARAWVQTVQNLLSHPLVELQKIGTLLSKEIEIATPRMTNHLHDCDSMANVFADEFEQTKALQSVMFIPDPGEGANYFYADSYVSLVLGYNDACDEKLVVNSLKHRENRYSLVGSYLSRIPVRFTVDGVTMAEMRDLNRHRTGTKFVSLCPLGFYSAQDQIPDGVDTKTIAEIAKIGLDSYRVAHNNLKHSDHSYIYYTLLGHQYNFEHNTTCDKFIYEAELRTGTGSHYKYAQHFNELLDLWYKRFPSTKGILFHNIE